jgi:hypothetical protein
VDKVGEDMLPKHKTMVVLLHLQSKELVQAEVEGVFIMAEGDYAMLIALEYM